MNPLSLICYFKTPLTNEFTIIVPFLCNWLAGETCALACAEACERRADANGKFEVTLTRGSEEMRRFEQAIATREAREREAVERLAELERDEKARGEGGGRDGE